MERSATFSKVRQALSPANSAQPRKPPQSAHRMRLCPIVTVASFAAAACLMAQAPGYTITTVAGGVAPPYGNTGDGGPATSALLFMLAGIAVDAAGNLYIAEIDAYADSGFGAIRKVSPNGIISTVAGGDTLNLGDGGPATSALVYDPQGIALDATGNLYIAEFASNRVRKVSTSGTITTVAGSGSTNGSLGDGGAATSATLKGPIGVAVDLAGNLYIADSGDRRVRKVSPDGIITTVAGNGPSIPPLEMEASHKRHLGRSRRSRRRRCGQYLYRGRSRQPNSRGVTCRNHHHSCGQRVRRLFGRWGLAILAAISSPISVAVDANGNLYIVDSGNSRVRVVSTDGKINTIAGDGSQFGESGDHGPATTAGLGSPFGLAFGSGGEIYVSQDLPVGDVRLLTPSGTPVFPLPSIEASGGVVSASAFGQFSQLALGSWVDLWIVSRPRFTLLGRADFSGVNAPTSLDGTSVTIGGQPAFISYISPGQINAQVPTGSGTGAQPLVVTTSAG